MTRSKHRIQWLDFAKGFAIFDVLFAHSIQFTKLNNELYILLKNIVTLFPMPIFFAISGYLYKRSTNLHKYLLLLYKKTFGFIIPYLTFTLIFYLISNVHIHHAMPVTGLGVIKQLLYYIFVQPYGYLWFLYALFLIFIVVGLFDLLHINLVIQILFSIVLLCYQGLYSSQYLMPDGNVKPIASIGGYMLFFYIGYLLHKYQNTLEKSVFQGKYIILLVLIWVITLCEFFILGGINNNTSSADIVTYYNALPKLMSVALFFSIFVNFNHNWLFKYFDKYGKQTLIIYLASFIGVIKISNILMKISSISIVNILVLLIIQWYFSIFVCKLSNKFKFINFIFYTRKYLDKRVKRTSWGKKLFNIN